MFIYTFVVYKKKHYTDVVKACHTRRSGGVKASYAKGGEVYLVCGGVLFYSKYTGCSHTPNCRSNAQNFLYRLYCLVTLFRLAAELRTRKSGGCATTHGVHRE